MELVRNVYDVLEERSSCDGSPEILVKGDIAKDLIGLLRFMCHSSSDLDYTLVMRNIEYIFSMMKFDSADTVRLTNLRTGASRFNNVKTGNVTLDYSVNFREFGSLTYYSSNELFCSEGFWEPPVIALNNQNETLYYNVDSGFPHIRKYDIELSDGVVLSREFTSDGIIFRIEGIDNSFSITIKGFSSNRGSSTTLENELLLVEYLRSLTSPYDIPLIYNKLCEISLGDDVSKFSEITLCESKKIGNEWQGINLISIKNGDIDSIVRTVGDKTISCSSNGWGYRMDDDNVVLTINVGDTIDYNIRAKSKSIIDDYTDELLKYDVSTAMREVEETRELVRKRCRLENKKRG